jgi:hypothetical protein
VSAEWIVAVATAGTFVVIAASAMAALVQLRHMRQSNQIAALNEAREVLETPQFVEVMRFIRGELPGRLQDPAVRRALLGRSWHQDVPDEYRRLAVVANFFESLGLLVKQGIIDRDTVCELMYQVITDLWEAFGPIVIQRRIVIDTPTLWENFEYLAVVSDEWVRAHPTGNYPRGTRRWTFPLWSELEETRKIQDSGPSRLTRG